MTLHLTGCFFQEANPTEDIADRIRRREREGLAGLTEMMALLEIERLRAEMPSNTDLEIASACLASEGNRPWHVHPRDCDAVQRVADWLWALLREDAR